MATGNITRLEGVWPETHERAVRDSAGVNLETKLGNINSNISQLDADINGAEEYRDITASGTQTKVVIKTDGSLSSQSAVTLVVSTFPVSPGAKLKISGRVGNIVDTCLACFYDENGDFIAGSSIVPTTGTATPYLDISATAPEGARSVKVAGNSNESYPYSPAVKAAFYTSGLVARIQDIEDTIDGIEGQADKIEKMSDAFLELSPVSSANVYIKNDGTTPSSSNWVTNTYDVTGKSTVLVDGSTQGAVSRLVKILDADGVLIEYQGVGALETQTYKALAITLPNNAAYMMVAGLVAGLPARAYESSSIVAQRGEVELVSRCSQGEANQRGIPVANTNRCHIVLDVPMFTDKVVSVRTDADKYVRNLALMNTETRDVTAWLYSQANSSNIASRLVSGTFNRIVIILSKSNTSAALSPSDVSSVVLWGDIAGSIEVFPDFAGKTFSVMGDSIGSDDIEDTPAFIIQSSDVGNPISSTVTWFDYNDSVSDTATGRTKTIGNTAITSAMVGTVQSFTPVAGDVGKTLGTPRWSFNKNNGTIPWWRILGSRLGMSFNSSASWNGNSYTSHEESDNQRKAGYGWDDLQIQRLAKRDAEGNRIAPDVIFLCRGVNDATHTPYAKLTNYGEGIDTIPANDTVDGGYGFKEAIAKTVAKIRAAYPNAVIYLCTLTALRRLNDDTFPMDNGMATMQAYNKAVKEIAEYMECKVVDFSKCWNFYNCVSGGYVSSADYTHPVQKGHYTMFQQALKDVTK